MSAALECPPRPDILALDYTAVDNCKFLGVGTAAALLHCTCGPLLSPNALEHMICTLKETEDLHWWRSASMFLVLQCPVLEYRELSATLLDGGSYADALGAGRLEDVRLFRVALTNYVRAFGRGGRL